METLGWEHFMEINDIIEKNNHYNDNLKIFMDVEGDYLLDIRVRFVIPDGVVISPQKEDMIHDTILQLSNNQLILNNKRMIRYGILELNTSYAGQGLDKDSIMHSLQYITRDMMYSIMSDSG